MRYQLLLYRIKGTLPGHYLNWDPGAGDEELGADEGHQQAVERGAELEKNGKQIEWHSKCWKSRLERSTARIMCCTSGSSASPRQERALRNSEAKNKTLWS